MQGTEPLLLVARKGFRVAETLARHGLALESGVMGVALIGGDNLTSAETDYMRYYNSQVNGSKSPLISLCSRDIGSMHGKKCSSSPL